MRRILLSSAMLALVACSDAEIPPEPTTCSDLLTLPVTGVNPESPGTVIGTVIGTFPMTIAGKASAYQQGSTTAGFTVIDGFITDANDVPTGELFLFLRSGAKVTEVSLVPVTLAELRDPAFVPTGSFAVFATAFDSDTKDYTKWLLGTSGCLRIPAVAPGAIGRVSAVVSMSGEWKSASGSSLGTGSLGASLAGPTIDFRSGANGITEEMSATVTGVRAKTFGAFPIALDGYQVLFPGQQRLLLVGTQPAADTTRELWLSVAGVPQPGDSIELGTLTLAEARAGRTSSPGSFGMLRLIENDNSGLPVVREIWRSTSGWVKFNTVVQTAPLALCGLVSGTFAMTTQGTSLATPAADLGTTSVSSGSFTTRMTILAQSDTIVDTSVFPTAAPPLFSAISSGGLACP